MAQWGTTPDDEGPIILQRIYAPFTQDQIDQLNRYQNSGVMHPFTCGGSVHSDQIGSNPVLVAYEHGWHCPHLDCDYTQGWAHSFMADKTVLDDMDESRNQLLGKFFDGQHARRTAAARHRRPDREHWKGGDLVRFTSRDPHPDDDNSASIFRIDDNGDGYLVHGPWIPGDMETLAVEKEWTVVPFTVELGCEVLHDAYEKAAAESGWETNPASRQPWADVPEANKEATRAAVTELFRCLGMETTE